MEHKYKIGDVIANEHYHYLVEDIDVDAYSADCYMLRCLEDNRTLVSYISITDRDYHLRKVA